jgi:hypothetical protein
MRRNEENKMGGGGGGGGRKSSVDMVKRILSENVGRGVVVVRINADQGETYLTK